MQSLSVNQNTYIVEKLLGHGKGGYSYLVSDRQRQYVLKQIHHEPCSYYQFGNKLEAEIYDYQRLSKAGIRMPQMFEVDTENERILKEYIDGPTIFEYVCINQTAECYFPQIREIAFLARSFGLNIDYFPTNFVIQNDLLYYIDYECNPYSDEWNFENWGIQYWSRTPAFEVYLQSHISDQK